MASKTHTAPVAKNVRTSFDLQETAVKVLTSVNAVLPGRGMVSVVNPKTGKTEEVQRERKPESPVLFNPEGRGINGYNLVLDRARKFGADVTLQDMFDALKAAGYAPQMSKDGKSFRCVPIIGAATVSKTDTSSVLASIFGD